MDPYYEPPIYGFYRFVAGVHQFYLDLKQYRKDKKELRG